MVNEHGLYEELGMGPDATSEEIKSAYYMQARKVHPDKRRDDPEAAAKFQALGEAYQVLSDPARKARYDEIGKASMQEMKMMDASVVFGMVFGSEAFEDYIGQLQVVILAVLTGQIPDEAARQRLLAMQEEREAKLVQKLTARVEAMTKGDSDFFISAATGEAVRLSKAASAKTFLRLVGYMYEHRAGLVLGCSDLKQMGLPFASEWVRSQGHYVKTAVGAAVGAAGIVNIHQEANRNLQTGAVTKEGAKAFVDSKQGQILEHLWKINVADIEKTLTKVLHDPEVPKKQLYARARAVQGLGSIFGGVAKSIDAEPATPEVASEPKFFPNPKSP